MNQLNIPDPHMPLVLNSLIHEHALSTKRRLNPTSTAFEWKRANGTWVGMEGLVNFAADLNESYSLLIRECKRVNFGLNIIYKPTDEFAVVLLELVDDKPTIHFQVNGVPLEHLICLAILSLYGDCKQLAIEQNKVLFPQIHLVS